MIRVQARFAPRGKDRCWCETRRDISSASNPATWPRNRWEPLLFEEAGELNTRVAILLFEPCTFPALIQRRLNVFDATTDRLTAMRLLKRWIRKLDASMVVSQDLHSLYRALADQPGSCTASGQTAERAPESLSTISRLDVSPSI